MVRPDHLQLTGLHHVSSITASARLNRDFYTRALGLRLVKKTVNQDAVDVYHLFYADGLGSAGTDVTFFEIPHSAPNIGAVAKSTRSPCGCRDLPHSTGGRSGSSAWVSCTANARPGQGSRPCRSRILKASGLRWLTKATTRRSPGGPAVGQGDRAGRVRHSRPRCGHHFQHAAGCDIAGAERHHRVPRRRPRSRILR